MNVERTNARAACAKIDCLPLFRCFQNGTVVQDLETNHIRNKHGSMDNVEIKSKFGKSSNRDEMSKSNEESREMEQEDD